jgi:hypothetical protein
MSRKFIDKKLATNKPRHTRESGHPWGGVGPKRPIMDSASAFAGMTESDLCSFSANF